MNWRAINHSQFEDIACRYAQDIHADFTWIPTQKTHDGNKDGAFESEIRSLNIIYKGWYEAKYTKKLKSSISKSHMDSTLVSGILDGSVVYILFITNGRIHRKFRRRAKAMLTPYRIQVDFVEGDILEEWLARKSEVNNLYFGDGDAENITTEIKIEVDDLCFFDAVMTPATLISPIRSLIVENEYYLYVSIRSNISAWINIHICNECLIQIPKKNNENELQIHPGFNSFFIKCYAKHLYKGEFQIDIRQDFERISHKILSDFSIEKDYEPCILYGTQTSIIQEIYNYTVINNSSGNILAVEGEAGTGKSYLLKRLLQNITDKNNDILIIQLSDKDAENACALCKLILFLNFGNLYMMSAEAFSELIKNSVNLPLELYHNLREGVNNQIIALETINTLSQIIENPCYALLLNTSLYLNKSTSYIIIDDFHKISPQISTLCRLLLNEFTKKTQNQIMILGYRPEEFNDAESEPFIRENCDKRWRLNSLSNKDINNSIEKNTNKDIAKLALLFDKPVNILHLSLLIKKLIEKSIINMSPEMQVIGFDTCYKETNIQNSLCVKSKIRNCKYKELLFLIYKIESGISVHIIESFYGTDCRNEILYLKNENFIKQEGLLLKPFHDVYLYAFHDLYINEEFNDVLVRFLEFCIDYIPEQPDIQSNILALLLSAHRMLPSNVIESMKKSCISYYETSKYIAAKVLAKALLPDLDTIDLREISTEDIQILYIYAMSIKYSQAHEGSNKYLSLICDIGKLNFLDSNHLGYVYEAYSELLNNTIWMMNKKESQKHITYLENLFKTPPSATDSTNKVNAYLNLLNRKFLYSSVFLNDEDSEDLYDQALTESKRLNRKDYEGYAMMDKAKNMLISDPKKALPLLEKAYEIFLSGEAYLKRRYDCEAEIVFLKTHLYGDDFDQLYRIQHEAYKRGLFHVYAKIALKILALELSNNYDADSIELRLKQLFIQSPDMKNKHRLNSFADLLWSAIYYRRDNYSRQSYYARKHLKAFKNMNENYQAVAQHNCKQLSGRDIIWYREDIPMDENSFWLDIRLW